jgi:hypothetical protein
MYYSYSEHKIIIYNIKYMIFENIIMLPNWVNMKDLECRANNKNIFVLFLRYEMVYHLDTYNYEKIPIIKINLDSCQ